MSRLMTLTLHHHYNRSNLILFGWFCNVQHVLYHTVLHVPNHLYYMLAGMLICSYTVATISMYKPIPSNNFPHRYNDQ